MLVIGIDPGLAHFGCCVVNIGRTEADDVLLKVGVCTTEKTSKKQDVRSADDMFRRSAELANWLVDFTDEFSQPTLVCMESISYPRNSVSSAGIGMSFGIVAAYVQRFGVPVAATTPQELKMYVSGRKSASKEEVQSALSKRFPNLLELLSPIKRAEHEHAADAVGAVVACYGSQVMKMFRTVQRNAA